MAFHWSYDIPLVPWSSAGVMTFHWCYDILLVLWPSIDIPIFHFSWFSIGLIEEVWLMQL